MVETQTALKTRMEVKNLNFYYGSTQALKNINMPIYDRKITALIGPSGCGKTTLLRCLNRMHDLYPNNRYEGDILLDGESIFKMDVIDLRSKVGMVFKSPHHSPCLSLTM